MEVNTFLAIENRLNCNDTIDEQKKYVPLIIEILKINQEVIKEGLSALEKHIQDDKLPFLLKKGLRLIHYAMEPQIIETILLNTAIVNCIDGLTALICLDGALSIQRMYSPDITKELLCSYLSPDLSDELNGEAGKLKLDGSSPLSTEELQKLLNDAEG
ncbi:hypothetical protein D7V90_23510 [bacterium 1xD42-87]|nr:hypothetical protein D7V90_23510 [bacterium 1xD42-87]